MSGGVECVWMGFVVVINLTLLFFHSCLTWSPNLHRYLSYPISPEVTIPHQSCPTIFHKVPSLLLLQFCPSLSLGIPALDQSCPTLSNLAEMVGLAICTCFSLTANGTLRETRRAGCMFRCKHSKRRKAREKEAMFFKETMSNYVPS